MNENASTNNIFPKRSRTFSVSELLFCLFVLFVCFYLHSCFFSYIRIDFNKHNASPTPPGGEISNSATLKMVRDMDQKKDMMQSNHEPSGIINDFWFQKLFLPTVRKNWSIEKEKCLEIRGWRLKICKDFMITRIIYLNGGRSEQFLKQNTYTLF